METAWALFDTVLQNGDGDHTLSGASSAIHCQFTDTYDDATSIDPPPPSPLPTIAHGSLDLCVTMHRLQEQLLFDSHPDCDWVGKRFVNSMFVLRNQMLEMKNGQKEMPRQIPS